MRAFYDAYRSERGEVWKCKEWPGKILENLISQKYGRLLIFFCRHKDLGLILEEYARLNFASKKSGTPASGHHVKHINSLCRTSESWAGQMMRRTMVSQLQDVGTKTMIERVNNPATDTEANNGSLHVGRWSAATLWTMQPPSANEEKRNERIMFPVLRKKSDEDSVATWYKCRNTDIQGVSTQKKRSNFDCVATCSKIQKSGIFAEEVDDSCYKKTSINKRTLECFSSAVASVARWFLSKMDFLTPCFYLYNLHFWRFHD